MGGVISQQGIEFQLVANGVILDLFADEEIKLSDNVTGLFDLGVIPADFTRQITLPGTKKNNAFFEHVYDISVDSPDTFATNIKVPAYLDFGGLYLSQGYLQLNKVSLYQNKFIDSYEVTIFGAVSSFARTINRSYLTDLSNLSVYNHTSSYNNITSSWSGSLFNGDIIYPLADYGSGYQFTSGQYELFGMDDQNGALGVQNFKPAIRLKKVWDAIFDYAGYTYSSSFLEPYKSLPTVFTVTNNGSGNYVINGESNPSLQLQRGVTYTFNINAVGHPFWINIVSGIGTGNAYNSGVTNNGTDYGTITFTVPYNVPSTLYYNCQYHSGMAGTINIVKSVLDDVYLLCDNELKYPKYAGINLETYGKIKVGAISGSGMTDKVLTSGSFTTLPWYNVLSDQQGFYNNGAYEVKEMTNLKGVLNLNINVSCSVNNMPGTLSANGTWQIRMIETGSSTPYSTQAIQSYIFFFDQLQKSRSGAIDTTYQLATEFKLSSIPVGNYYFQIKQSPDSAVLALPIVTMDPQGTTKSFLQITEVSQAADGRVIDIPSNMPFATQGIKLIDFLIGVQKKYNLVIYPSKTVINQFIVESFNNWYNTGRRWDFNKYVNLNDKIEVIPANNLAVNELNFGDTLDTDYVSQQFSKAANREYSKQYYVDTNNFFSQGKFEVKTTLASSPLLKITGTGLSGSVSGLNTPVTQYSAGYQHFTSETYQGAACGSPFEIDMYTADGLITQGQIAYYDQYGITPITGYRYFTYGGGNEVYEINFTTGVIGYGTGFNC